MNSIFRDIQSLENPTFAYMVVKIKKEATKKDILVALEQIKKKKETQKLSDFYGKLKGVFGDGVTFQKEIRNEWD